MDVSKTSFVCYECLEDVFLYVMYVSKTSFCMLWMSKRHLFVCYVCLKDVFCTLCMSKRRLFVRYGCLKDVSETACIHWGILSLSKFNLFSKFTEDYRNGTNGQVVVQLVVVD